MFYDEITMAQYQVSAVNPRGKNIKILVESDSVKGARQIAKSKGLTPLKVIIATAEQIRKQSSGSSQFQSALGGIKSQDIADMTRQLASLIKSNVPVVESLNALIDQIENKKLRTVLVTVRQNVKEGRSLADSFRQFPNVFNRIYVNMVRAGESSGSLDVVMLKMADFLDDQQQLKSKVSGAMLYPIILMVIASLVMVVLFIFVIPEITRIFESSDLELPVTTKILIFVSEFAQKYIVHIFVGLLASFVLISSYVRTKAGRARKDKLLLRLPVLGKLIRNIVVARVSRTLGTLLKSGVSMINALEISRNVSNNHAFEEKLDHVKTQVAEGRSLAYCIKQTELFPPIVIHMINVGEKTGELEDMLLGVADNFENQVNANLNKLTAIINPIMIIIMAVVVGIIVWGVLMPMLQMANIE